MLAAGCAAAAVAWSDEGAEQKRFDPFISAAEEEKGVEGVFGSVVLLHVTDFWPDCLRSQKLIAVWRLVTC